ncbi:NYN domain-containing protein [Sansalvadorimonas verongulae]|uniref:NYN domain-containing protein n=1 Tax=Sansalvadorimonas verongulae TaxID=2172824 RepID=UPI0012BD7A6C|nr:NYN domain-containing protein [Sansalvadorimonas verongulae]MTI11634.1 NYN domain-containing protein [Sansalvadorimonas verongulae]
MDIRTAVLVDGSFFVKRLDHYKRKFFRTADPLTAEQIVKALVSSVRKHLRYGDSGKQDTSHHLYRIYYYDAPPLDIKVHYPLSEAGETRCRVKDYKTEPSSIIRGEVLEQLKMQRKLALRLGTTKHDKSKGWRLTPSATQDLLKKRKSFTDLTNADFVYEVRQKGVDIKLGLDISTLSYEKQVDKIILIAGDSDFVPAAKMARKHGIDFILDPLRNNIDPSLNEQ